MGQKKNAKKSNASAKKSSENVNATSALLADSGMTETASSSSTSTSTTTKMMSSNTQQASSSSSTTEQRVTTSSSGSSSANKISSGEQQTTKIVEVVDNGTNVKISTPIVEYTVTGPMETPDPTSGKVHYVFGGTQISEVGSAKDRGNRSKWDGSFTYETAPVMTKNSTSVIVEQPGEPVVHSTSTMESHASSSASSVQKSSSTSYAIEIGSDGKERIVDSKTREWGSSHAESQAESFRAKSGTGIETEVSYAAKEDQERTKFDSGDGKKPKMFEHSAVGSEHYLEQIGKNKPIEHVSEHAQNVSYDAKTDKFLTSSSAVDNKAAISGGSNLPAHLKGTLSTSDRKTVIDSTSLQHVDKSASATSIVDQTERFLKDSRATSDRNAALTTENMEIFNTSTSSSKSFSSTAAQSSKFVSSSSKNVKDVTKTAITEERRTSFDDTASNNTFIIEEPFSVRHPETTNRTDRNQSNWNGSFVYENANGAGKVVDKHKNVIDSTTTYTSKVFDAMSNTWRIVDETTVNEKDVMIKDNDRVMKDRSRTVEGTSNKVSGGPVDKTPAPITQRPAAGKPSTSSKPRTPSPTKKTPKDKVIKVDEKMSMTNMMNMDSIDQLDVVNSKTSSTKTSSMTEIKSDFQSSKNTSSTTFNQDSIVSSTPLTHRVPGPKPLKGTDSIDNLNTVQRTTHSDSINNVRKTDSTTTSDSKTTKRTSQSTNVSNTQVYDEKTKTWREVDEKTLKTKRPSLVRYVSQEDDGTFTTIFKRKVYDSRSGKWNVVDEKVIKDRQPFESIPEMIEDVTNMTTTTYTTKVYDTKTGKWTIVDEQKYTDRDTKLPSEIVQEIEKDHADVANVTTTTEITKVRLQFHYGHLQAYENIARRIMDVRWIVKTKRE